MSTINLEDNLFKYFFIKENNSYRFNLFLFCEFYHIKPESNIFNKLIKKIVDFEQNSNIMLLDKQESKELIKSIKELINKE